MKRKFKEVKLKYSKANELIKTTIEIEPPKLDWFAKNCNVCSKQNTCKAGKETFIIFENYKEDDMCLYEPNKTPIEDKKEIFEVINFDIAFFTSNKKLVPFALQFPTKCESFSK